jgi:hypothetical protein
LAFKLQEKSCKNVRQDRYLLSDFESKYLISFPAKENEYSLAIAISQKIAIVTF